MWSTAWAMQVAAPSGAPVTAAPSARHIGTRLADGCRRGGEQDGGAADVHDAIVVPPLPLGGLHGGLQHGLEQVEHVLLRLWRQPQQPARTAPG